MRTQPFVCCSTTVLWWDYITITLLATCYFIFLNIEVTMHTWTCLIENTFKLWWFSYDIVAKRTRISWWLMADCTAIPRVWGFRAGWVHKSECVASVWTHTTHTSSGHNPSRDSELESQVTMEYRERLPSSYTVFFEVIFSRGDLKCMGWCAWVAGRS